ncbi:hypothetical protein QO155_002085 [Saccharomyces cerevisiae]|nr:hypothetical protein QO155_002085 [Saccharomyces cerevisiae]
MTALQDCSSFICCPPHSRWLEGSTMLPSFAPTMEEEEKDKRRISLQVKKSEEYKSQNQSQSQSQIKESNL